jgi:yersiniabactin nonribosomal peptide/polyketide synthase
VPVTAQEWQDEVRYAGVSSFGIGGTNCHMIVASLPDELNTRYPAADDGSKSSALLLSAASDTALRQLAADYAAALGERGCQQSGLHGITRAPSRSSLPPGGAIKS